jgi:predicted nucleotidyltransferase
MDRATIITYIADIDTVLEFAVGEEALELYELRSRLAQLLD